MGGSIESISRRKFVALGSGLVGALGTACCRSGEAPEKTTGESLESGSQAAAAGRSGDPYAGFRMGIQTWCLREFKSIDTVIQSLHELGLKYVEIAPSIHLPLETPTDEIKAVVRRFKDEGITIDSVGVLRMNNDEASCRKIFEYSKLLGVLSVNVAPEYDALALVDRLTEEYSLPVAIHNHGPEDRLYARPVMFREHLAKTSNRVGLCVDTGHYQRSGIDSLPVIDEFSDRINGIHVKDMVPGRDGWVDAIVGQGLLDLPGLVARLKAIRFNGFFSLEYESDPSNPMPAMKKCLAEIRKACATLSQ